MKNVVRKVLVLSALLGLLVVACPTKATVLFSDNIAGYTEASYPTQNSEVVIGQNSGSLPWISSANGEFVVSSPDQVVNIASGMAYDYTTLAVNKHSTARYGQVVARIGYARVIGGVDRLSLIRFGVAGVANPQLNHEWATPETTSMGPAIRMFWGSDGQLQYVEGNGTLANGVATNIAGATGFGDRFATFAMNYDLQTQKYSVWLDGTQVASNITFANPITSAESMFLGGCWIAADGYGALDWWQWQTSTDTAFTTAGIPEPATLILLGLGAVSLLRKRAKA